MAFLNGVPALESVLSRTTVVAIGLGLVALARGESFRLSRAAWPVFLYQCMATLMVSACYLASVQFLPVTLSVIVFYLFPVLIVLAAPLAEGRAPGLARIGVALLGFAGLVVAVGPAFENISLVGLLLAFGAAVGCMMQFFSGRMLSRHLTPAAFGSLVHIAIWPVILGLALGCGGGQLHLLPGSAGPGADLGPNALLAVRSSPSPISVAISSICRRSGPRPSSVVAPYSTWNPSSRPSSPYGFWARQWRCRNGWACHGLCRPCHLRISSGKGTGMTTPLPVSVLTGFLGSGKTTLLNGLLKDPLLANACVIINEFGEVGIDHLLVEKSDENVVELSSGCLCCTIRGDLIDTLADLLARRDAGTIKAFDRIVIETTGLADPAPILHVLMMEPLLVSRLRLEGVITVVDGFNGMATLDAHPEAVKQVAVADRIVLTKLDLLVGKEGEDMLFAIIGRVRKLAPGARLLTTHRGEATAERLFNTGFYDPSGKPPDVKAWLSLESVQRAERAAHAHQHVRITVMATATTIMTSRAMMPISAPSPLPTTTRSRRRRWNSSSSSLPPIRGRSCCA